MAYKKNRLFEDVNPRKSYFHFCFNTNLGAYFPMQAYFYLRPEGHQIFGL